MSEQFPDIARGDPITARWLNAVKNLAGTAKIVSSPDIVPQSVPGGGTALLFNRRRGTGGTSGTTTAPHPFQIYWSGTSGTPGWRTVAVRTGTLNNITPSNIGSTFAIPASQTDYKIYLTATIITAAGLTQGNVSAVQIDHSLAGWTGYPSQPDGNSTTGAPPSAFYVLLGLVTTSTDGLLTLTLPNPQPIQTSLWVDMIGYEIFCVGGFQQLRKRMTVKRV